MVSLSVGKGLSKQDYETPAEFIQAVNRDMLPIRFDLAASTTNAKAARFFTKEDDSLVQDWAGIAEELAISHDEGLLFLNPPFENIAQWAKKCTETAPTLPVGYAIGFLIPIACGSNYWRDFIHEKAHVFFLNGRLKFDGKNPFPKDCAFIFYSCHTPTKFYDIWEWTK